jgi:hypothetical protein
MLFLAIWSALAGAAIVETQTYAKCESVGFRWKICATENELCKLGKDTSSCKFLKHEQSDE